MSTLSLIQFTLILLQLQLPEILRCKIENFNPYASVIVAVLLSIFSLGVVGYYLSMLVYNNAEQIQLIWATLVFALLLYFSISELFRSLMTCLEGE